MDLSARNLNTLPVLLALLEEESVVGAAERIGLSQPTVSGVLGRLRKDFDDPLLVRVGRTMRLTNRARMLLPLVTAACASLDALYAPEAFDPQQLERQLVIAAPDHLALLLAPRLIDTLAAEAPGTRLRFVDVPNDLGLYFDQHSLDLAVCGDFGLWPELINEPLFRERIVAAMCVDHPLAGASTVSEADLRPYPLVQLDPDLPPPRGRRITTGVPLFDADARVKMSQFTQAVLVTIDSYLIAPAPKRLVERLSRTFPVVAVPLADGDEVQGAMFWKNEQDTDPAHQWLRGVVRRSISEAGLDDDP